MSCPICNDTRWRSIEDNGVERVVRCECWRNSLIERLMSSARIPARYSRCELDNFEHGISSQLLAWRKARAFVDSFPIVDRGLLMYGPHGVGKTHLAVGILKAVIREKGARGYFFETRHLLREVRNTYNDSVRATENEVLRPVMEADVLVLDDLGAEKQTEWVQETLGLVVNTRYNAKRATIFTSNLAESQDPSETDTFIVQLGARTRSRLLEMCDWLHVTGPDIRDIGPHASASEMDRWYKESPASPDNVNKARGLPPKTGNMARARLKSRQSGPELKWTGGKAES
jgi:DNA replication protein DnaC